MSVLTFTGVWKVGTFNAGSMEFTASRGRPWSRALPEAIQQRGGLAAAGGGRCQRGHRFGGRAGGCAIELPIHIPGGWIGVRRIITSVIPPI